MSESSPELVELFIRNAEAAGFVVHRGKAPSIEGALVSRAAHGVAATGSVVIIASPEEPRGRHLLPATHVSLLREDAIVRDLGSLFAMFASGLPSSVAIVTGPSRSADIEQRLVVGVHGPREVHVVVEPA
jgi:L-lactate dehydrogenase complex protein LldG